MIKKHQWIFLAITVCAVTFFYVEDYFKAPQKSAYYYEKLQAANLAAKAMATLKEEIIRKHIPSDSINDPNATYLVGTKHSAITENQQSLTEVLIALNPNFSAAIVEMFTELKLIKGDIVALNVTGSFPGLNIGVLSACEIMKLDPVIVTAVSSTSFGANNPEFTWLDMETLLYQKGIFSNKTIAASLGGENDNGEGISPDGRILLRRAIERNNTRLINSTSLADNIGERFKIISNYAMRKNKKISVYIDVGGTITGFGQSVHDTLVKAGINKYPEQQFFSNYGLIQRMTENRIPIIFLGDIAGLAIARGLTIAVVPQPLPGEDELFCKEKYSVKLAIFFLICLMGLLFLYIRIEIYLKRK